MSNSVTWKEELIRGLKHFGGEAHRKELFEYIKQTTSKTITKEYVRTLQKELERLSEDSNNFSGKKVFYSVEGIGAGVWGLCDYSSDENMDITQDDITYPEGKASFRKHIKKERNPQLVRNAKRVFREKHGKLFCELCFFDFEAVYGELGKDFIEAHHNKEQVANMSGETNSRIEDLIMLCPNCHSMVHRLKEKCTDINELRKIIKK